MRCFFDWSIRLENVLSLSYCAAGFTFSLGWPNTELPSQDFGLELLITFEMNALIGLGMLTAAEVLSAAHTGN